MKNLLNVAIIQTSIVWENPAQNRLNLSLKIQEITNEVNLIVLQEMFTTGYTLNAKTMAETMTGHTVNWMLENAKEKDALIMGSVIIQEENSSGEINYFNRLIVAYPTGEVEHYDKRHLFSFANENKIYTAGKKRNIIEYKGWKLLPLICYDLRFPVWARNSEEFDALIYVANWPQPRITAWDTLLKARAIENLCYVIGVNRLGLDANGLKYSGHSAIVDSMGQVILEFGEGQETIKSIEISKSYIDEIRIKFGFLNDRDNFKITI